MKMDFDVATFILRLVVGGLFIGHGMQKLAAWFGGSGIEGTTKFMESLNLHPPRRQAIIAGASETAAGVLLVAGFLMPLAALLIVAVMMTAILTVHLPNGIWNSNGGYEFNLVNVAVALALACVGPGWLSLDNALSINWSGWEWSLAALAAGAIGASVSLAAARRTGMTGEPHAHAG